MTHSFRLSLIALLLLLVLPFAAPAAENAGLSASAMTGGWRVDPTLGAAKPGKEAEFAKDRARFAEYIEVIDIARRTWGLYMADDNFMITDAGIVKIDAAPGNRYALHYYNIPKVMIYTVKDKNTLTVDIDSGTVVYKRLPQDRIPKRPKPWE